MGKNLIYAILFSTLILYVGMFIQERFFSPQQAQGSAIPAPPPQQVKIVPIAVGDSEDAIPEETIQVRTNKFLVTLSTVDATIISLKANTSQIGESAELELIPLGTEYPAFNVRPGPPEAWTDEPVLYRYRLSSDRKQVRFFRDFTHTGTKQEFTLTKTYTFLDDEQVFELSILLQNKQNEVLRLGEPGYTLLFGPQLGPIEEVSSEQKSRQISRRRFISYYANKRRYINVREGASVAKEDQYRWMGIEGRYFTLLMLPNSVQYTTTFSAVPVEGLVSGSQISLARQEIRSAAAEDTHRIYIGPRSNQILEQYNIAETNGFGIAGANFEKSMPQRWLRFLEVLWLMIMRFIHSIIPNYGVAIIVLTILIRFATYPIIRKSRVNGEKMKLLSPMMQEIKTKYANDSMKQSQEMMALYKKYGFSPMSSMLPIFIQLPVFLSMYRVISESFELFQSPFFGWIDDLSKPDALLNFAGVELPILGWSELHLLPVIMLGTQYVSSYIMMRQQQGQTGGGGSQKIMFILSYVFPVIIFFALYNSPSGLILYWITSNLVTVLTIFDTKPKLEKLIPVKKKEITPWKKYLKQERHGRR